MLTKGKHEFVFTFYYVLLRIVLLFAAYVVGSRFDNRFRRCLEVSIKNAILIIKEIILLIKLESVLKLYPSTSFLVSGWSDTNVNIF